MEDVLDQAAGRDLFYEVTIPLTGSTKKVYRVMSRVTGESVVDFMTLPTKKKKFYKLVSGIRWETLEHAKGVYKKILKDPKFNFRWNKAREDLRRIEAFQRSLERTNQQPNRTSPYLMRFPRRS